MMIGQMIPGFNEALLTMDEGAIWESIRATRSNATVVSSKCIDCWIRLTDRYLGKLYVCS